MATDTRKSTNELQGGDQPLYQPWNDFSGRPQTSQSQDDVQDNGPTTSKENYDNDPGFYRNSRANSAVNTLRNAENGALSNREAESSLYTGQGRNTNAKSKAKGGKKKIGALITILCILGGGAAFLGSSNTLLLDAVNTLFTNATDYQYSQFSQRILKLVGFNMDSDDIVITEKSWTGALKYKHMSSEFEQNLANAGFTFEGSGGKKTMTWTYDTGDGTTITRSGITASEFIDLYNNNVDFRGKYSLAADNRAMTAFDASANGSYRHIGNTRNTFNDFEDTGNNETNLKNYQDTVRPKFDGDSTTLQTSGKQEVTEYVDKLDANGNPVIENGQVVKEPVTKEVRQSASDSATTSSSVDVDGARSMINKVSGAVSDTGNFYCAAMKFGNMISMAIAGNEIYQSIQFFMTLTEPLSKTKAGFGDQAPVHQVLNWFSTKADTEVSNFGTFKISGQGKQTIEALSQSGSPLESNGMRNILANAAPNTKEVSSFSLERVDNSITGQLSSLATSSDTAGNCARFSITDSIVSIGLTIASGGLTKIFANVIGKALIGTAISVAISTFFSFLTPTIQNAFFTNAFDNAKGQPGGELFARGSGAIGSQNARRNSGYGTASKTKVMQYNKTTNAVLALDAEVDRQRRSPFDISSPNTFFGSIAYSLLPTLTSTNLTGISSILTSTMSSLSTLIGGVHADGENSSYMTTFGECPALESIGATGDMYCNPIPVPDTSTADITPDDQKYQEVLKEAQECDSEGNCTIKPESDLAKYITYYDGRDSPLGVVDQNILAATQPSSDTGIIGTVLNQIPIVGDIINIVDSGADIVNLPWATGAIGSQNGGDSIANLLAATDEVDYKNWWNEKGKYYQRYVEDSRILNMMGAYEATNSKDPVLAYKEEYEQKYLEEHPEANTYIGYLSRVSGLTIENTETTLAFIGYLNYIDQYDPTLRIAMDGDTTEIKTATQIAAIAAEDYHAIYFENDNLETTFTEPIIANHHIIYADVRNRSYAIC